MKKIALIFAAVVAVSFASCCGKCGKTEQCGDSCQVDSDSICAAACVCPDSAACDSACSAAGQCICAE